MRGPVDCGRCVRKDLLRHSGFHHDCGPSGDLAASGSGCEEWCGSSAFSLCLAARGPRRSGRRASATGSAVKAGEEAKKAEGSYQHLTCVGGGGRSAPQNSNSKIRQTGALAVSTCLFQHGSPRSSVVRAVCATERYSESVAGCYLGLPHNTKHSRWHRPQLISLPGRRLALQARAAAV